MKILIISHEYPPIGGGGANACMFLAKEYALKGNEVSVVTVFFEGLKEYEELYEGRLKIYRLKAKRKHKEHCGFSEMADYLLKARPFTVKLHKEEKFDICQAFFGIPSGPLAYLLKKKTGLPYVIRFGGGDIPGFQNRFKLLYKLLGIPLKVIWKKADALVANSEGLKQFALNFYDKCDIEIINNGVDSNTFYPANTGKSEDRTELLFVSRLIERKGLQNLIPHLKELQERSTKPIHLTIVGDGPYRDTLEQMTDEAGVRKFVTFVGQKDKGEIAQFYRMGDVFVFPSSREGMPNAVLEAMASGLPIIMMKNCEGSKELVTDNGILAENDFCEAVGKFLRLSEADKTAMGIASCERAKRDYTWEGISGKYLNLFNSIVKKNQKENVY